MTTLSTDSAFDPGVVQLVEKSFHDTDVVVAVGTGARHPLGGFTEDLLLKSDHPRQREDFTVLIISNQFDDLHLSFVRFLVVQVPGDDSPELRKLILSERGKDRGGVGLELGWGCGVVAGVAGGVALRGW